MKHKVPCRQVRVDNLGLTRLGPVGIVPLEPVSVPNLAGHDVTQTRELQLDAPLRHGKLGSVINGRYNRHSIDHHRLNVDSRYDGIELLLARRDNRDPLDGRENEAAVVRFPGCWLEPTIELLGP